MLYYKKIISFLKKLFKKLLTLVEFIVSTPIVLLIIIIRPFILIRFGSLYSYRIGHFAADTEAYLCNLDEKPHKAQIDIISCPKIVCNKHLKKMWARTFRIFPGSWLWEILDRSCQFWTRGDRHHIKLAGLSSDYKYFLNTSAHLNFTHEEEERGQKLLKQLGIPPGSNWICIHNRDSAYLDQVLPSQWAYHDYRDFSIQSMVSAADELTKRGYYVIRIGSIQSEKLSTPNQMIIDYSSSKYQSEFGDI